MNMQVGLKPIGATSTAETSAASFAQLSAEGMRKQGAQLYELIVGHQRNGGQDMTGRELQQAYEARFSVRIDAGAISSAVSKLVAAGKLRRRDVPRACAVTGRAVLPVFVPAKQASLV